MEKLNFHTDPSRKIQNALLFQALKASKDLMGETGFKAVINRADTLSPGMRIYLDEGRWPPQDTEQGPPQPDITQHYLRQ